MKGVNHRNKIGNLHIVFIYPHFWDAINGNSRFGSTAKVDFKVGMYIYLPFRRGKKKKSENKVLEMDALMKSTERGLCFKYVILKLV